MDTELISRGLKLARKRKNWLFLLAAIGFSSYGAYKVYHLPRVASKRRRLLKLLTSLASILDAFASSAEAAGVLSKDLKEFLGSESDQLPNSLKQVSKIAGSEEFVESLARVTQALTAGALKGYKDVETRAGDGELRGRNSGFYDRFFNKLFSASGSGFASVVVAGFARNLVMAFYADEKSRLGWNNGLVYADDSCVPDESSLGRWASVMYSDRSKELIGDCIQVFVSTAVSVYLEKTMNINTYDQFFAGVTNPEHEERVSDMVVSVCNRAVETFVKTSNQVLTSTKPTGESCAGLLHLPSGLPRKANQSGNLGPDKSSLTDSVYEREFGGWVSGISSTLSVPSNRSFILDITGRVTFETVRSVLQFFLEKFRDILIRSYELVHDGIANKGIEVVRSVKALFTILAAMCLSLCLHILDGAWLLLPASVA